MLSVLEKVIVGFAIVCGAVTLIPYLWWGTPSTRPLAFLPSVTPAAPAPAPAPSPGKPAPPPAVLTQSDKDIIESLKTQIPRFRGARVQRLPYDVPVPLFEELSKQANVLQQLKTARRQVLKTKNGETRLKVYGIEQNSYLRNFGLEDNDIIELIDGQIVEFSEQSSSALYGLYHEKLAKLRSGEAISLTISRGSQPVHLEFKLPK